MVDKIICPDCGSENIKQDFCSVCNTKLKLNDKYFLIDILGENNQITYLGIDNLNNRVILKELKIDNLDNWKTIELFDREISILKEMNHNQIPKLIDEFKLEISGVNSHYLVMEFIDGITLEKEMNQKRYNEKAVLDMIKEITEILKYLHSLNPPVIHRDIKLTNIMRRKTDNKLVLIDFGAVTDLLKPKGGSTIVGTYGFMAPEQFMGKPTIQSDYYSVGAVAFMLLTHKDFSSDNFITDSINVGEDLIKNLDVSNNMKALLSKLLAIKLKDRVANYNEVFKLIDDFYNLKFTENKKIKKKKIKKEKVDKKLINNLEIFTEKYKDLLSSYNVFIEAPKTKIDSNGRTVPTNSYANLMFIPMIFVATLSILDIFSLNIEIRIIISVIIIIIFSIGTIKYQRSKEYKRKKMFLDYALKENNIEFILTFLNNHAKDVISLDEFLDNYHTDKGKMILYGNLLQQMKNKNRSEIE